MAYNVSSYAGGFGSTPTGTWPSPTVGSVVMACVSLASSGATFTPPSGWTQIGASQSTPGHGAALFRLNGLSTGSAPALGWTASATQEYSVEIVAFTGRANSAATFATPDAPGTTISSPAAFVMPGGTALSGDDLLVFLALFTGGTGAWAFGAGTGTPGVLTNRGGSAGGTHAQMDTQTLDNIAAGATGSITIVGTAVGDLCYRISFVVALPSSAPPPAAANALFFGSVL